MDRKGYKAILLRNQNTIGPYKDSTALGMARKPGLFTAVACILLTTCVPACSTHRPLEPEFSGPRLVWPAPPAQPRLEYVRSFRTPRDLGIRSSWFARLVSYLIRGRTRHGMVRPYAVATDAEKLIAVADPDSRCVHLYDLERSRYHRIIQANDEPLASPVGVAIDPQGWIYVSDSHRRAILRFDFKGKWINSFGLGELVRPTGLAFDAQRRILYVTDTLGHKILTYSAEGKSLASFGTRGLQPGAFNYPVAVAVDGEGHFYVNDSMNFRVQIFDASGEHLGSFGQPGRQAGDFDKTKGIAVDREGHIYLVEALHDVVQVYDQSGRLLTVLGGTGTGAGEFWLPTGISIDANGRIFVADSANHRIQIFRYLGTPNEGDTG